MSYVSCIVFAYFIDSVLTETTTFALTIRSLQTSMVISISIVDPYANTDNNIGRWPNNIINNPSECPRTHKNKPAPPNKNLNAKSSRFGAIFHRIFFVSTNFLFELVSAHRREMQLNSNVVSRVRVAQRTQWKAAWEWRSLSSHRGAEWRALEGPQQLYFPFFFQHSFRGFVRQPPGPPRRPPASCNTAPAIKAVVCAQRISRVRVAQLAVCSHRSLSAFCVWSRVR